jgi:hypothetical protein
VLGFRRGGSLATWAVSHRIPQRPVKRGRVGQLAKLDPETAGRIGEHRRIIAFRNILVHGYAGVDDMLVWDMVVTRLADLRREVEVLLGAG